MERSDRIRIQGNPYPGVNAHLESLMIFRECGWMAYHNSLMAELGAVVNGALPAGYLAINRCSLQVNDTGADKHLHLGLAIYTYQNRHLTDLVARIELLLPEDEAGNWSGYLRKQADLMRRGIPFVEINLTHRGKTSSHPTLPDYETFGSESERHPYAIWSADPRPSAPINEPMVFDVDDPIPSVPLRLLHGDLVLINVAEMYERFFHDPGWGKQINYVQPPQGVESYRQFRDQVAIAGVMETIRSAHAAGHDLSAFPLSKPSVSIELLQTLNLNPERVAQILGLPGYAFVDEQPSMKFS